MNFSKFSNYRIAFIIFILIRSISFSFSFLCDLYLFLCTNVQKLKTKQNKWKKKKSISSTPIIISIISIYLKLITRTFFFSLLLFIISYVFFLSSQPSCLHPNFVFRVFFCLCLCCERMYVTYMCVGHKQETNYERVLEYFKTVTRV